MRLLALVLALASPTADAPVVVAGAPVARAEVERRAVAFSDAQFLPLADARPYVVREVVDERWAVRDAAAAGVPVPEAQVDAALARVRAEWAPRRWEELLAYYGTDEAGVRERVRGELSARVLADRLLRGARTDAAYGRAFLRRHARRRAATRCRAPYVALDRCRGARRGRIDLRTTPLGLGQLRRLGGGRVDLELDLPDLLGIDDDGTGVAHAAAGRRLTRALARRAPAVARRLRVDHDAYAVYVAGRRADLVVAARTAHRLALAAGRPVPVLH